jgi:hypothetical protein
MIKNWVIVVALVLLGVIALAGLKSSCTGFVGADGTAVQTCRSWIAP